MFNPKWFDRRTPGSAILPMNNGVSWKCIWLTVLLTLLSSPIALATTNDPTTTIGYVTGTTKAANSDYAAAPVLNNGTVPPLVMLVMSRDEQLFLKAYSDYSDLDNDGQLDTTYKNSFEYSGYFDPALCYTYASGQFKASATATNHQCGSAGSGLFSGNFMNWVAMSRLDVVRYVLYGGLRSTDGTGAGATTVLERAAIPNDLHAWAKVYMGTDVAQYTPWAYDSATPGISFCNATLSGTPTIEAAKGNWSEWAATAATQCGFTTSDSNKPSSGLGEANYTARIQVCDSSASAVVRESFCQPYVNGTTTVYKPVGLLQRYGENKQMRFGLLTGSFSAPRSGGVLRRNIGVLAGNVANTDCGDGDEISLLDGHFCTLSTAAASTTGGIITTLNALKLTQWSGSVWSDCSTYSILNRQGFGSPSLIDPGDGSGNGSTKTACSAWGNPLSEMYAEALRYIANDSGGKTAAFNASGDLAGLPAPNWQDPYGKDSSGVLRNPYCAACSIIVLSTGLNSFDSDEIPAVAALGTTADDATKTVGVLEGISGNYLVGRVGLTPTGTSINTYADLCTSKTVTDFSLVRGICPDVPSMEGSYLISGLAYKAWTTDMRPGLKTPDGSDRPDSCDASGNHCQPYKNRVQTYAIALAESLPKFQLPLKSGSITLAPLCQANNTGSAAIGDTGWRSCYLGSVGVGPKTSSVDSRYVYGRPLLDSGKAGSFSEVWEDSLWGNDHDNDVVSMITYCVGGDDDGDCNLSSKLPTGPVTTNKLCFYIDVNYGGNELCPTTAQGNFNGGWKNNVSSIRVPADYAVTLYDGPNQTGASTSFTSDNSDFTKLSHNGSGTWNDKAQSFSITGGTVPPAATNPTYAGYDICWQSTSKVCTDSDGKPTVGADQVLVRVETLSAYAGNAMLSGYFMSGSDLDGAQKLVLRPGNSNGSVLTSTATAPADWGTASVIRYTLDSNTVKQLENPLFYAAKYGGFSDQRGADGALITQPCDSTTTPACTTSNWDQVDNITGEPNAEGKGDGQPDNFFQVRNPAQLGERLAAVFSNILNRSGSGTAAAVVANSSNGSGVTYQALYQSQVQNTSGSQKATWTGNINALWIDSSGNLRQGGYSVNGVPTLGNTTQNPIVVFCTNASGESRFETFTDTTKVPSSIDPTACAGSPMTSLKPIWAAQDWLDDPDLNTATQRAYSTAADLSAGRYIFTWIDANHNGVVDAGEQRNFSFDATDSAAASIDGSGTCDNPSSTGNFRFLNTCDSSQASSFVSWLRGKEATLADGKLDAAWRSRTIADTSTSPASSRVYRLGDIVDSTPLLVGTPAEALDLLYNDSDYGTFRAIYQNRRQMLYVGANDGMLHAFNAGFYDSADQQIRTQPIVCKDDNSTTSCSPDASFAAHPLGSEVWAYVPGNLLPHLRWLTDPNYLHMFYVDGSPISQDVKIFASDTCTSAANNTSQCHPGGWGTILIVPFRFGGGKISLPTTAGHGTVSAQYQNSYSAYVVMDVTNPEAPPKVLAELTNTSGSGACAAKEVSCSTIQKVVATYTSSLPAEAVFRPRVTTSTSANKFFLFTGSGTTDNGGSGTLGGNAESTADLTIRAYDLASLPTVARSFDFGSVGSVGAGAQSFAGDLIASDFDLDGLSENLFFGSDKSGSTTDGGSLWTVDFAENPDPTTWTARQIISDLDLPVTARPTIALNSQQTPMVFFGTGRAFTKKDLEDKQQQLIAGVDVPAAGTVYTLKDLLDVTDIDVSADNVVSGLTGVSTVDALSASIYSGYKGWRYYLDYKNSSGTTIPSERVVSAQSLYSGVLLTTTYIPGTDQCTDQGVGRLYGMNYATGTADATLSTLLGKNTSTGSLNHYVSLGKGLPSQPSLSKVTENGTPTVRACVQTSSGAVICEDVKSLSNASSGETSWREPLDK